MSHNKCYMLAASIILMLAVPCTSFAQQLSPQTTLPGSVIQDLQQKTIPSGLHPDTQKTKPPSSNVEGQQKRTSGNEAGATVKAFYVKEIHVEGVTLLTPDQVNKVISAYENKNLTFTQLQEIADKLSDLYYKDGYVTSHVFIPPQKFQNGELTLKAIEGRMGNLSVKPGHYFSGRSVVPGFTMDQGDYFNTNTLRRNLREYNLNPDRSVRAVLKPGEKPGQTDVELDIADQHPIHLVPFYDNLGRTLIGRERFGAQILDNNVLGFGDQFLSAPSFTFHSFGIVNRYEVPIGSYGTKIGFEQAFSHVKLVKEFKPLDVTGNASMYSPFISQDLIDRDRWKVSADLAFDFQQLDTDLGGGDFTNDDLRVLRPGINVEEYDHFGKTMVRHEFGLGLDWFGGSSGSQSSASRKGAGSKFFRYTGTLTRLEKMPWHTYGVFRLMGQLTPDRLVSTQQFQIGGAFTVRGYPEGMLVGDDGLLASMEWRLPFFLLPESVVIPNTNYHLRDNIQLVPFLDYGLVTINKPIVGVSSSENALGVGVGLRAKLTRFVSARLDMGFPMIHQAAQASHVRLHFGLESNLF